MANRLISKSTLRKYQKSLNMSSDRIIQNTQNPEATKNILGGQISAKYNIEKENLLPEYNDLQFQSVYMISTEPDALLDKELILTSSYFELPYDFSFTNVGYTAFKQIYRFTPGKTEKELEENLKIMRETPKVAFSSQCQPFYNKYHNNLKSYKVYLFAPELCSSNAPELKAKNLPILYVLNIIYNPNNPNVFRITMQAVVGGREDGLFNLMILDRGNIDGEFGTTQEVCVRTRNSKNCQNIKLSNNNYSERLGPEYQTLEGSIKYFLEKLNIHYSMTSTLSNEKVLPLCESLVNEAGYLDVFSKKVKKIDEKTVMNSIQTYQKEKPFYHKSRILNESYVLTDKNGRVKNSLSLKAKKSSLREK